MMISLVARNLQTPSNSHKQLLSRTKLLQYNNRINKSNSRLYFVFKRTRHFCCCCCSHSSTTRQYLLNKNNYKPYHYGSSSRLISTSNLAYSSSSSSTADLDDDQEGATTLGGGDMYDPELDEMTFEQTVEGESSVEDELSYLKIKLYEIDNETEPTSVSKYIDQLYDAASIQQVFDIVEESEKELGEINLKIASQALVTVWDLQKLIFKVSSNFEPERDYFNRPTFISKIGSHPFFHEKIVRVVMDKCDEMEDEPLLATLLCLKKMNFNVRSPECEKFIEECIRRKDTLSVGSLSRLFVCLRDEGLYGVLISAKFQPLLMKYVGEMSTDLEVRLVSIALRNSLRVVSEAMVDKFNQRISELKDQFGTWENVTLCKVFLLLMTSRNRGSTEVKELFDAIGEELIPRVPNLQLMDVLTMQKFLELSINQPYGLVEALVQRMMRTVQEGASNFASPRLDFLASIAPYMKTVDQKRQMGTLLKQYLDTQFFDLASGILFTILRCSRTKDMGLYDQFWNQAEKMVVTKESQQVPDKRIIKMGKDYVNFLHGLSYCYRNNQFEQTLKRYYYQLIRNYLDGQQPCVLGPGDFSKLYCFLIGTAYLSDPIFQDIEMIQVLDDFAPQFRITDLSYLTRGIEAVLQNVFNVRKPPSKYYEKFIEICSIVEEQCARLMIVTKPDSNRFAENMAIHKCILVTRKVKGDSPIVEQSLMRTLSSEIVEARSIKDLAQNLMIGRNNIPEAHLKMFNALWKFRGKDLYPDIVEKFLCAVFTLGWDLTEEFEHEIMDYCGEQLNQNWDKLPFIGLLQASTGLCYYKSLPKELVQNIFSVEFLDQIDAELTHLYYGNSYPARLRTAMMELNRAVCIDMPDSSLPWFHERFCEDLIAMNAPQETYLHREVNNALENIVGDPASVQRNVYSPYYYKLDFLIEFDEKHRPIKKHPRRSSSSTSSSSSSFFQKLREPPPTDSPVHRKVAVLLLSHGMFTKNLRNLKGLFKMRRRHLEILGYDVIEIDPKYWNSMFMSENAMRYTFLESKLYANARVSTG